MERTALLGRVTWQVGEVVGTVPETPDVRSLLFDVSGWPGHLPGQHVDVRLTADDGYQAVRSYSIASPPEDSRIELAIERLPDGEVSPYLVETVQVGDRLELRGPIGGYFVWEKRMGGPLFLVAGGSGIAPLMAMLRHRAAVAAGTPTRLLYSTRTPEAVIFREELARASEQDPALSIVHTYTRSQPPGWTGYARRVDLDMLRDVAWPTSDGPLAYICGPTSFVESVAAGLLALGYPPDRVKTERFGPTGG